MAEVSRGRVLLVEDNDLVRSFAARVLASAGLEVVEFSDSRRALEASNGCELDVLVSDVRMPGMSGPVLAEELRRNRPRLKVLYLSGHPDFEAVAHRELESQADFLAKPFGVEDLVRAVRSLLDE